MSDSDKELARRWYARDAAPTPEERETNPRAYQFYAEMMTACLATFPMFNTGVKHD